LLLSKKDSWEEYYGLPFSLTDDQRSVLLAITSVLQSGERLAGLLMGDVGSGKTLVALLLAMAFLEKGQQVAFLCPTQLLAQQHFQTACTLFPNSRQAIALMTAQTPKGEQETLRQQLLQGESPTLVIGTHRLFQKDLVFASLSLVIIDEQHRFGVAQRKQMVHKGTQPHVLSMTATPIPRSMAMYRYGEFQVFQLKEKPKGRQSIHTVLKKESNREQLYPFLRNRLKQGERLYWVFPFIEGEEADWTKSAVNMHEYLSKAFPEVPVGLIHGQLDALEQERIMNEFKSGSIAILITTTIIEVGVDVTEATVMVIEHANRFGVSQLHQLRGRVGRGQKKSYCFVLLPDQITQETEKKFRLFEQCQDGFVLAEFDLSQRGLGELGGVKQSGNDRFRWLDLWRDRQFLASTAAHYQALVQPNPQVMVSVSMLKQQLLPREEAGLLS
jgi:ATP-dependent DNA helicase RecG